MISPEVDELKSLIENNKYLLKDYYEYFVCIDDEPIKEGYERLIREMLALAGLPPKKIVFRWSGIFSSDKVQEFPLLSLSCGQASSEFKLEYQGETVDLPRLLPGLNLLIRSYFPAEKRKLQSLQFCPDQTDCVWFVTEGQLEQLCPLLHKRWKDFSDHCCTVTEAKIRKKEGQKGVLALCRRSMQREWERLNNLKWKIYPAKGR